MLFLLLLCVFVTSAAAQARLPENAAQALLLEARKKVELTLNRIPKYMCTETVDRSTFQPKPNAIPRLLPPLPGDRKVKLPPRFVTCDDLARLRRKSNWTVHKDSSDRLRLDVAVSADREMFSWAGENRFEDRALADLVRRG